MLSNLQPLQLHEAKLECSFSINVAHTLMCFSFSRKYKQNGKRSGAPNIYVEHTSLAVFNVGAKLDGDENVGEYEACDTDDEEKKKSKA